MVSGGQQYQDKDDDRYRFVKEVERADSSGVNEKIDALTFLVQGLAVAQIQNVRCGVCSENRHFTDACPILQDPSTKQACYGSGDAQQDALRRRKYDPYSNTYNPEKEQSAEPLAPKVSVEPKVSNSQSLIAAHFPSRLIRNKEDDEKEIFELFKKIEINLPLIDDIKQVPRYTKFLKELCAKKMRYGKDARIKVGENVSAVIQRKLPQKCRDPDMFTIPYIIGSPMKETRVIIQLANRSNAYPQGVVEDVLVKVNDLIFSMDFYIVDMDDSFSAHRSLILLGRPFMKTVRTKIDVDKGMLSFEFDGDIVIFNIFEAMKHVEDPKALYMADIVDQSVDDFVENNFREDRLEQVLFGGLTETAAITEEDEEIRDVIMQLLLMKSDGMPIPDDFSDELLLAVAGVTPCQNRRFTATFSVASSTSAMEKRRKLTKLSTVQEVGTSVPPTTTTPDSSLHDFASPPDAVKSPERMISSTAHKPSSSTADSCSDESATPSPLVSSVPPQLPSRHTYVHLPPFRPASKVHQCADWNVDRILIGPRVFDWENIAVLGVNDQSHAHITHIGWSSMLDISLHVYHDMTLEFLSSYVFDASRGREDSHAVLFTLGGREFNLSINTLNVLLGFETDESLRDELYENVSCEVPASFSAHLTEKWVPLGSFITLLAQRLHVDIPEPIYVSASYFTLNDFCTMHLLFVNAEGQYQLSRPGVSGPSHSASAGTSSGPAPSLAAIEELFERFTHRLESHLDALDDCLAAVEQAVINFSYSP
ncbi:hypothetical protein C2S51_001310 [Perilla frutescens var. frutescens]|nr:hypothetical protein C2S51_001310 [Perilla frutescens var. frutescens]